jgi:drug/metabolite transporter (DMT)-like permease
MMRPVLYGLGSALGFGIADTFATISTRRVGVLATMLVIQLVDVVALSLLLITPLAGPLRTTTGSTIAILAAGVLGTLSFFLFYRGLQLGPIAIVSPVFASSAAIPVVLSVAVLDERLSRLAALGIGLTLLGVVLASAVGGRGTEGGPVRGGIPFALAACLAWGVASFLIGRTSQEVGWFIPVFGTRAVQFVLAAVVVATLSATGRRPVLPRPADAGVAAVAAVADAAGVASFARGSEVGLVSIVSAVSSTFPLVVIAAGVALFGERPTRVQWAGITTTVVGLVVLGLGR